MWINFQEKEGEIALDQIRTVDKRRLIKEIGYLDSSTVLKVKLVLKEMLID